jgi:hypothetical protein
MKRATGVICFDLISVRLENPPHLTLGGSKANGDVTACLSFEILPGIVVRNMLFFGAPKMQGIDSHWISGFIITADAWMPITKSNFLFARSSQYSSKQ